MQENKQIEWSINIDKPEFGPGDKVRIIGVFTSSAPEPVTRVVHSKFIKIGAYDFPAAIIPFSIQLEPGKEREFTVAAMDVDDDVPPGEYSARVWLAMPGKELDLKEVGFKVAGTPQPLDFRIVLSRDRDGKVPKKIFYSEDKEVYIKAVCDAPGVAFSGKWKNPVGKESELVFKEMFSSCPLAGEGAYYLSVTARAEGYKTRTKNDYFSVIREKPVFRKLKDKDGNLTVKKK